MDRTPRRPVLTSALAIKLNAVVAAILLVTMVVFVSIHLLQEREALLTARAERLAAFADAVRVALETAPAEGAFERLRARASAVGISIEIEGTSSHGQRGVDRPRRRIEVIGGAEVWLTSVGLVTVVGEPGNQHGARMVLQGSLAPVSEVLRRTLRMHVVHGLATVVVMGLGIAWLLERAVLAPIRRMLSAINVVERGTWEVDLPVPSDNEMGALTSAFNHMGRNLARSVRQWIQAEKLSTLALLSIRVGGQLDASLREIEEGLAQFEGPQLRHQEAIRSVREATRRVRRALQSLDAAFSEAFAAAQSQPGRPGEWSSLPHPEPMRQWRPFRSHDEALERRASP